MASESEYVLSEEQKTVVKEAQLDDADEQLIGMVIKATYDAAQKRTAAQILKTALETAKVQDTADGDAVRTISRRIKAIDDLISERLDQILHDPKFQALEASWRGLHMLVFGTETSGRLKLRVMNIGRDDLQSDLEKAVSFDQSALFKKVYEEEYGTFGGNPFSMLMADYSFGRKAQDVGLLTKLSNVAAAAHAPLVAAAEPGRFNLDSFTELGNPRDLAKGFEGADAIKWNKFRDSDDARYVTLVLPRMLLRLPYGDNGNPVDGLGYEENVFGATRQYLDAEGGIPAEKFLYGSEASHEKYLWGNPAWALTQRITDAFAKYGWWAAIRGVEGGGAVTNLPVFNFPTEASGKLKTLQCPTEITITDRREKELSDLGFVALCHKKNEDMAVFFGGQTAARPKKYNKDLANANAGISTMLPYVLAASRFAHYVKVLMRDKIGSFATREQVERYLNNWIADYVLVNDNAPQAIKAQYPLREARVDVVSVPGKVGAYRATMFLKPHFQLEELTTSIRLVAELPPPAAA
jgi:type VI secretion system protein ImpC